MSKTNTRKIAYQGEPGANSHIACKEAFPGYEPLACRVFEDAFAAVSSGDAALAMIPIDNSVAGRVADIHHLMPQASLYIVAEHFLRVHHQLLVTPGAEIQAIRTVRSHIHALGQCRKMIRELKLQSIVAEGMKRFEFGLRRKVEGEQNAIAQSGADESPEAYKKANEDYFRSLGKGGK